MTPTEPFYLRQTADLRTPDAQRVWFKTCADEAKAEGAQHARFSIHPSIPNLLLVEAWRERPRDVIEGEQRWMLKAC